MLVPNDPFFDEIFSKELKNGVKVDSLSSGRGIPISRDDFFNRKEAGGSPKEVNVRSQRALLPC